MPTPFQIACLLILIAGGILAWAIVPDLPGLAAEKLLAGGMWSAVAAFLVAAMALTVWPRDPEGRLRGLRRRSR